ncbi:NAD-dependent epimerase/dehydratase family protein [Algihabitans albus]|uniref:NAD-dependent epimerase/dehydratase family protein n=1 Tax=Algihabitans albus TaxID=2164067 RepID=UPI000E5CCCAF|nr:NAD-dependent epimerase/dehydratase family protein [Algihabitans albus]
MRILVTGATGFVGKAVTDELHYRGHDIVGLARSKSIASARLVHFTVHDAS